MPRTRVNEEPDYLMINRVNENRKKVMGRHSLKTVDVMGVGHGRMVLLILECNHLVTAHDSQLLPNQKFHVCLQCALENRGVDPATPRLSPRLRKKTPQIK